MQVEHGEKQMMLVPITQIKSTKVENPGPKKDVKVGTKTYSPSATQTQQILSATDARKGMP